MCEKHCKECGAELLWGYPNLPGTMMESSSNLEDWPICKDCMIEHCVNTSCLACDYGKYPDCRFLDMDWYYQYDD